MVALRSGTLLLAGVVAVSLLGTAPAAAAAPGTAPAASTQAYYQAAVNLIDAEAPGASGFVGSVSFTLEAGRTPTADVYLSRAETVDCADGTEDIAQVTLRTEGAASATGPVTLDIDRRLLGIAVETIRAHPWAYAVNSVRAWGRALTGREPLPTPWASR